MKKIFSICIMIFITIFILSNNIIVSANEWEQDYKYYTTGIVDGGAYKIKNVQTGLYMTLANDATEPNTNIVLSSTSTEDGQKFYVRYLGDNKYIFEPYNSKTVKFSVLSSVNGARLKLSSSSNTTSTQRFRITALNSSQYTISTNISSFDKVLNAEYASDIGWSIVQNSKLSLSENEMKWEFEKVDDRARDKYTSYYIRDINTDLYVTVNSIDNNAQVSLMPFTGKENQRFKKYLLNNGSGFGYYYVPMIKTDVALEIGTDTVINLFDKNNNQKFSKEYDSSIGAYKLQTLIDGVPKYISKGASFVVDSATSYKLSSTSSDNLAIKVKFERAYGETPFIYNPIERVTYNKTTINYAEKHLYILKPKVTGDYTFFIKRNNGDAGLVVYNSNYIYVDGTITNYADGQKYKVSLEKNKIYYIQAWDYDMRENNYEFLWMKDLTVYIHAMNTSVNDNASVSDRRTKCAIPCRDLLNSYEYYDPIINLESDMTTTFIKNVDTTTGLVPLCSPIYIFRGHGAVDSTNTITGVTYSTGTETSGGRSSWLMADDIYNLSTNTTVFNMNGNKFSAWIGCQTAKGSNTITEASWKAGSTCSLGFEKNIGTSAANRFTLNMFKEIEEGYSIANAVDRAHSGISFWFSGLESAKFYGNSSIILKPYVPSSFSNMQISAKSYSFDENILNGYRFMYENSRGTLKRYIKIINGYVSDDYIDVYYENNNIIGYYKSKSTYTSNDILRVSEFKNYFKQTDNYRIPETICSEGILFDSIVNTDTYEQIFSYNNNIIPLRFYVTTYQNSSGNSCLDIKIINVKTRELVSEEVMFE